MTTGGEWLLAWGEWVGGKMRRMRMGMGRMASRVDDRGEGGVPFVYGSPRDMTELMESKTLYSPIAKLEQERIARQKSSIRKRADRSREQSGSNASGKHFFGLVE